MTVPSEPVPVPAVVTEIAAGRPVAAVWVNELGGVTFAVDGGREYVKVSPPEWAHHLVAERDRLAWAAAHVRVPRVLGAGNGCLHTAGLSGRSAVDPHWAAGLRLLHDALPVEEFPFGPPPGVTEHGPVDRLLGGRAAGRLWSRRGPGAHRGVPTLVERLRYLLPLSLAGRSIQVKGH